MTSSIRTFLLINLLLSVTLITSLAIIGNLFLAHKDIQTQCTAHPLCRKNARILSDYGIEHKNLSLIQHNLLKSSTKSILASHDSALTKDLTKEQLRRR